MNTCLCVFGIEVSSRCSGGETLSFCYVITGKSKQKTKGKMKHDINRRGAEKEGTDMDAFVNPVPLVKQQSDDKESVRSKDSQESGAEAKDKDGQEPRKEKLEQQTVLAVKEISNEEPSDEAPNTIATESELADRLEERIPITNQDSTTVVPSESLTTVTAKSTDDVVDHARIGQDPATVETQINEIPKTSPVLIEPSQEEPQQQIPPTTTVLKAPDEQDKNVEVDVDEEVPKVADSSKSKAPASLRYTYQKDQWSPNNQTGQKVYNREFLMTVQDDPRCKIKPELPVLDVVLASCAKVGHSDRSSSSFLQTHLYDCFQPRPMSGMRPNKDVGIGCPGGLPFPSFMRSADTMSHPRMASFVFFFLLCNRISL